MGLMEREIVVNRMQGACSMGTVRVGQRATGNVRMT